MLTIRQVAKLLGIKVRTIREWIKKNKIKAVKIGNDRTWYIPKEEVYRKEVRENAIKGREHSKRIKAGIELGMLQRKGQDTEKSV